MMAAPFAASEPLGSSRSSVSSDTAGRLSSSERRSGAPNPVPAKTDAATPPCQLSLSTSTTTFGRVVSLVAGQTAPGDGICLHRSDHRRPPYGGDRTSASPVANEVAARHVGLPRRDQKAGGTPQNATAARPRPVRRPDPSTTGGGNGLGPDLRIEEGTHPCGTSSGRRPPARQACGHLLAVHLRRWKPHGDRRVHGGAAELRGRGPHHETARRGAGNRQRVSRTSHQ